MLPKSLSTSLRFSFYAALALLPFGIRHTVQLHDAATVWAYAVDLLVVAVIGIFYIAFRGVYWKKPVALYIFLLCGLVSVLFAPEKTRAFYEVVSLAVLALFALVVAALLRNGTIRFEGIAAAFALGGVMQALIGFFQFWKQGSIGLSFFGEALIAPGNPETAKVIIEGGKLIRASGTLPHANIFAAFLLLGLVALYHLWLRRPSEWKIFSGFRTLASDAALGVGIFAVWVGLVLSFSRTGWVIAALITLATIVYGIADRRYFRQGVRLAIFAVAASALLTVHFGVYISARAHIIPNEPSVSLRADYNRIGWEIIKSNLLGVGIGNQVGYAQQAGLYGAEGLLADWQQQPVHNLYILMSSEIGVIGLAMFLVLAGWALARRPYAHIAKLMPIALLLFGLTDHFLWTAQPGRLMLWLVLGIVIGV